jgi:hypothetical protein
MGVIASSKGPGGAPGGSGSFEMCPKGLQQGVCCDVVDHGFVKGGFKGKENQLLHKITIRWQSSRKMRDGKPYLIQRRFTCSLHERSTLRRYLEAWRGKAFTEAEAEAFDLDRLIGVNCQMLVDHLTKPRGVFAEVMAVMPLAPGMKPIVVEHYIRVQDRQPGDVDHQPAEDGAEHHDEEAGVGFDPGQTPPF